jgi:hypothetical protein
VHQLLDLASQFSSRQIASNSAARLARVTLPNRVISGVQRGDLDAGKLTSRIVSLPTDLIRHEIITTLSPLPRSLIEAFVDEIFLPLARPESRG